MFRRMGHVHDRCCRTKPSSPCLIFAHRSWASACLTFADPVGKKVFRWQNEKHFSLDYAFRTNSLLQGKTLSLTLWSTPMLNISMFFETNTATRKWDIVRLNFNSNTNASDNMIDFFLLGFDLNILSYFEAYLTHTQLSTVSSVSASRPWQVYTGARRICPLCLKASDQKLQKAPSKNLIKIKEWKKN